MNLQVKTEELKKLIYKNAHIIKSIKILFTFTESVARDSYFLFKILDKIMKIIYLFRHKDTYTYNACTIMINCNTVLFFSSMNKTMLR